MMKYAGLLSYVFAAVFLWMPPAWAQDESNQMPAGWQNLPISEFVDNAQKVLSAKTPPSAEVTDAIHANAAKRLRELKREDRVSYYDRLALYEWGRDNLTAGERAHLERSLADSTLPVESARNWSFRRMSRAHRRMALAKVSPETRESLVISWAENHDAESISSAGQVIWLCKNVSQMGRQSRHFSVRWTGVLQVPRDGDYTFAICPINVNFQEGKDNFGRQTTAVWIGGQQVLDSTQDGWTHRGTPVTLSADRAEAIRVEFSFEHSEVISGAAKPAIAKLSWEGPGIAKTLIPASAFSLPDGSGSGLRAEYRLLVDGEEQLEERTEPMIDHTWFDGFPVLPKYPELQSRIVGRLSTLATDPSHLAKWDSEETAPAHHFLHGALKFVGLMNSSQQAALIKELLGRPVLLEPLSQLQALSLYRTCRVGAIEQSLDLVGIWAQMHPNAEPAFDTVYGEDQRQFRNITVPMVFEYRPHLDLLEERYLEMPDGSCCLPVSYIVASGHLVEGRIGEWIEKLDARLDDDSLTGDQRVNWLLARAYAEEIRHSRPGRHFATIRRSLAGKDWIEVACLTAQSEPVKLRAHKELAVRLVARERFAGAREWLDFAATRFSDAASTEALAAWGQEIDRVEAEFQQKHQDAEAAAQQAYVERLRQRRQRASDKGNNRAVTRYEQLITSAGATIE